MRSQLRRGLSLAILASLCALTALFFAGCGEEEVVDPFTYATLDQVTRGYVQSKDFLYEIDAPQFEFVDGNTAIVRSGNHLEILVGDDLENRAPQLSGKLIGVQKFFSPVVWLMAKRVKDGLTVTDLDSVTAPVLPHFTDVKLDDVQGYDIGKLGWNQLKTLEDMTDAEVQTLGKLVYTADHQVEQVEPAEGEAAPAPKMSWYLVSEDDGAKFKITNVTPSLELAFRLLEAEGLPFVGGIKVGEAYTFQERRASRVSAPVEVQWLRYANRYLAP